MIVEQNLFKSDWLSGSGIVARAESVTTASPDCHKLLVSYNFRPYSTEEGYFYTIPAWRRVQKASNAPHLHAYHREAPALPPPALLPPAKPVQHCHLGPGAPDPIVIAIFRCRFSRFGWILARLTSSDLPLGLEFFNFLTLC